MGVNVWVTNKEVFILNKLYIGETGRLGDRVRNHLCDIRKNDQSKPVSRHFNSSNHPISDFVAFGLSIINVGNDCRKTTYIHSDEGLQSETSVFLKKILLTICKTVSIETPTQHSI